MKKEEISRLLIKYFEAETTLGEEKLLEEFFRQEEVPAEWEPYRVWFVKPGREEASAAVHSFNRETMALIGRNEKQRRLRTWRVSVLSIAASLILVMGTLFIIRQQRPWHDSFDDPEAAYACAQTTLLYVSEKYNQGMGALHPVSRISDASFTLDRGFHSLRKGFAEMSKINRFNQLTFL